MILSTHKDQLLSTLSGGILKSTNNGILTSIPINMLDVPGFLSIKGNGYVLSSSANPSNTTPDVLSVVGSQPYIIDNTDQVFSKIFTARVTYFDFEFQSQSVAGIVDLFSIFRFADNTIYSSLTGLVLSPSIFYNIALNHTAYSGLYQIYVYNIMAEYKSFWDK